MVIIEHIWSLILHGVGYIQRSFQSIWYYSPGPILRSLGSVETFVVLAGSNFQSRYAELLCILVSRDWRLMANICEMESLSGAARIFGAWNLITQSNWYNTACEVVAAEPNMCCCFDHRGDILAIQNNWLARSAGRANWWANGLAVGQGLLRLSITVDRFRVSFRSWIRSSRR